ncbi:MAG TPA: ATP-binding protein [Paraburkholderia sp.]|jgi:signal transduction histidine kinase|nr:ATP-binding protein [Paraburkholderia sp.]
MRLTTKGLMLIALPAVFEVTLLAGIVKVQADAADAQRWAQHSQNVLAQTGLVLDPVLVNSVRLRGAVASNDRQFSMSPTMWADVDRQADRLAALVSDNRGQVGRAANIRAAIARYREWAEQIQTLMHEGRRNDVLDRFRDLSAYDPLDRVRAQVTSFQVEERRLDVLRTAAAEAARTQQRALVVAAVVGSIVLVALLVSLLIHGVRGRLAYLSDNAARLAGNEPLAPPEDGNDEIAQLDRTLHETSRRLIEAERLRISFEADLARRAEQLAHTNETLRQQTQDNEMFVHSVSHDLRSPLVTLQGFSKELTHACDDLRALVARSSLAPDARERVERLINEDIAEALRYLQSAVLRASHIIDALLRLARVGRVEYRHQRVDVQEIVQRVIDAMHSTIDARRAHVVVDALPPVWGDPTALEQVFANLIGNALNYLDPARDGRVVIGVRPAAPGEMAESLRAFYVMDNGLGIPAFAVPRLFHAFQRMHGEVAPGEGIGLALVRRVVERHGGRVWAESAEGVGSTFYLLLPAMPDLHDTAAPDASAAAAPDAQATEPSDGDPGIDRWRSIRLPRTDTGQG